MIQQLVAGIDIGGTNTCFGLVDSTGNIVFKESVPTEHFPIPEDLVAVVSEHIKKSLLPFADQ